MPTARMSVNEDLFDGCLHHSQLPGRLAAALCRLAQGASLREVELRLEAFGSVRLHRQGQDWQIALAPDVASPRKTGDARAPATGVDDAVRAAEARPGDERAIGASAPSQRPDCVCVLDAGRETGELRLGWPQPPDEAELEIWRAFLSRCAKLVRRCEFQRWSEQRLGRALWLVGSSQPLLEMEQFIERTSHSRLPVVLSGEPGTEKAMLAAAIHGYGPLRERAFVEINCAEPLGTPEQWFQKARGGTLFLSGIDQLAPALQAQLPQFMHSHLAQWLGGAQMADVRIVAASTADLAQLVQEGAFSAALFMELDFLSLVIPPLRQRPEDIAPLVRAILLRHGFEAQEKISHTLIATCQAHRWPENLFELERVIARLAVMSNGGPIGQADILQHTPWVAGQLRVPACSLRQDQTRDIDEQAPELPAAERWVRCAVAGDAGALKSLHDGLRRALLYLGEHYMQSITLGQLAAQAHVSPSHLTYLFRSELGIAFKPFLQCIRVHKAKEILSGNVRKRITEVAGSVGFADLSHFEKSFRRIVGCSAREFRRSG